MIIYKIAFKDYSWRELFCYGPLTTEFKSTDINEAYRFKNEWWPDQNWIDKTKVYVKEIETTE